MQLLALSLGHNGCNMTKARMYNLTFQDNHLELQEGTFTNLAVAATMTLRTGGYSQAPWNSWNLGDHVGDNLQVVEQNRSLLQQRVSQVEGAPVQLAWARQVHGFETAQVELTDKAVVPEVDALWTKQRQMACCILVADCLPVLFAHRRLPLVAAAHAGWRGLCGQFGHGVIESTLQVLAQAAGQACADLFDELDVWLGPCIGPTAFEVGAEVREAFIAGAAEDAEHFCATQKSGKYWANLPALTRSRLARAGVRYVVGNDGGDFWCTYGNPDRYFSHRRDASVLGSAGRMTACIWLRGNQGVGQYGSLI